MSTAPRPVVVGVSEKQLVAVRFAAAEALRHDKPLRVVHCYGLPAAAAEFYMGYDVLQSLRVAGEAVLDDARTIVDGDHAPGSEYVLVTGAPANVLIEESREAHCVVLGADDIPWFDRMLGGEVAGHIARKAHCPVVVVPERAFPDAPTGGVVVTVDGDTSAAGPLRYGFEQADARSEDLHVLHAAPAATSQADFEQHQVNVAEVIAGWRELYPDVRVDTTSTSGDPVETCIAATGGASLVIIGRPHGGNISFALARPLAMKVLREARCPVAVVPADHGRV